MQTYKKAAKPIGPKVDQEKTKYLVVSRKLSDQTDLQVRDIVSSNNLQTSNTYLGTNTNDDNNMQNEIKLKISSGNKGY